MTLRPARLLTAFLLLSLLVLPAAAKKKPKVPEQFSHVSVTVLRDSNDRPIRNAAVVLHALNEEGKELDSLQLKTDEEGRASIQDIPYGSLRLQVVVRGLQTYGEDVVVNQPSQHFTIRLKPPAEQVTIYK